MLKLNFVFFIPTIAISLDLREEELADDAVDAGLQGSFLARRALSKPFSLGDGRGVPRGEAGSWWRGKDSVNYPRTQLLHKCNVGIFLNQKLFK